MVNHYLTPEKHPKVQTDLTVARGIFPGDIIIRTAIIEGINDLRRCPWLLDYVFAYLNQDELTKKQYGEIEIEQAKQWFAKHNIAVFMSTRIDDPKLPCVSIHLKSSQEQENTLGDVNYQPVESSAATWTSLTEEMAPISYNKQTGKLVLPQNSMDGLIVVPGMYVVDITGNEYLIEDVITNNEIILKDAHNADIKKLTIKSAKPYFVTTIESAWFHEMYQIGCHVSSDPIHLIYLYSILMFVLLRYKQTLFEARGFERSHFAASDTVQNETFGTEIAWSRFIDLSGFVKQYWPKAIAPAFTTVEARSVVAFGTVKHDVVKVEESTWIGQNDLFTPES
jgi:hypothetical protein